LGFKKISIYFLIFYVTIEKNTKNWYNYNRKKERIETCHEKGSRIQKVTTRRNKRKKGRKKEEMKILFMGTPDFAKASLEKIYEDGFNIIRSCNKPR